MKKILLLWAILQMLHHCLVYGQSWDMQYTFIADSSVFSLSEDKLIQGTYTDFFFPAYKFICLPTTISYTATHDTEGVMLAEFKLDIGRPLRSYSRLFFDLDVYVEHMDSVYVYLITNHQDRIRILTIWVHPEYTYLPTIQFSVNWENTIFQSVSGLESIQIVGLPRKEKKSKLMVGRLECYIKKTYHTASRDSLMNITAFYSVKNRNKTFDALPEAYRVFHEVPHTTRFILKECTTIQDSIRSIASYIKKVLDDYGLYDVYHLDKQATMQQHDLLADTSKNLEDYYAGLKEIIASLNSCHFRLATSRSDEVESPIQSLYFHQINDEIQVVAVFDPELRDQVGLGDWLISINNIPLYQLYEIFAHKVFASSGHQRTIKITQKLLDLSRGYFGDNLSLEFQQQDTIYTISLTHDNFSRKKSIPEDFNIVQGNIIEKHENLLYTRWLFGESVFVPFFYSHIADLQSSKGVLIDLRGISGGDDSFCSLFSCLINQEAPILQVPDGNIGHKYVPLMMKPSTYFVYDKPIVFLVDARTACFGELLINALKKARKDVFVIGADNTAASAQYCARVILPHNAMLYHVRGIIKDASAHVIDDAQGIYPDMLTHISSYQDLVPYEDKVKRYSLDFLNEYVTSNTLLSQPH